MANDDYQAAILKIVNEVDRLVTYNPAIRTVFTKHIDQLCKLAEDYGQAQQPYSEKLEKAKKRIEKFTPKQFEKHKLPDGTISISLVDICPPPKGSVKMNHWDNRCINVPAHTIYRPTESANPLLWFGIFGDVDTSTQRKPTGDEKLMCDYVRIALIHDYKSRTPADSPIFSADYKGKWFEWDRFREVVWGYYYPYPIHGITYRSATGQEKLSQLNRALNHVKADIEKQPITLTDSDNTGKTDLEYQNSIAIDDKELTILAELAEGTDKTFSQVEIEAATNIKRGTLKDKLPRLESIGLVHRPLGKRKGYQITDKGNKVAQRNQ